MTEYRGSATHLDERLDFAPPRQLLRTHTTGYLPRVALDAGDDGVSVWSLLGAFVILLNDDHLLARLATLEHNCDLHNNTASSASTSCIYPDLVPAADLSGFVDYMNTKSTSRTGSKVRLRTLDHLDVEEGEQRGNLLAAIYWQPFVCLLWRQMPGQLCSTTATRRQLPVHFTRIRVFFHTVLVVHWTLVGSIHIGPRRTRV
jgi:hypothetical protein